MRISELAVRSGVPVATIKYYLREQLLPRGSLTSATQATYDDSHLERLRLIRALIESAGLSIAQTRSVLESVDSPPESVHELLGIAAEAVSRPVAPWVVPRAGPRTDGSLGMADRHKGLHRACLPR